MYLWEGEGLTPRNKRLLFAAGAVAQRHGGPWILGGDFQNTPQDVRRIMAKWLEKVGGDVCAPGNLTCRSIHGGRTIDFFVVDSRISHGVQGVWCQFDFPSSPHYLVVLRIAATASRTQVLRVITPKSFEAVPAIGCQRKPTLEPSCLPQVLDLQTNEAVDEAFLKITTKAERHLCGIFDCVLLDGSPDLG